MVSGNLIIWCGKGYDTQSPDEKTEAWVTLILALPGGACKVTPQEPWDSPAMPLPPPAPFTLPTPHLSCLVLLHSSQ